MPSRARWLKTQELVLRLPEVGSALYVDYAGETANITDRETGQSSEVKIFVSVLGYSNLTNVEATLGETTADWISAQVRSLEYCGGVPAGRRALLGRARAPQDRRGRRSCSRAPSSASSGTSTAAACSRAMRMAPIPTSLPTPRATLPLRQCRAGPHPPGRSG